MNAYEPTHYPGPPRLLLGVTLLVWGALTNHGLMALGAALLIEGRNWLNWRWRFDLRGYSRAWILSLIALAGTVGFHSLNLSGPAAILAFIEWLPLIFLPLILAQQYGEAKAVPTSIFSVVARQRLKRERRLGKVIPESRIHLGYPYFALTLLATAFPASGMKQQWQYFAVMVALAAVAFYFANRTQQRRILPWIIMASLIAAATYGSSSGIVTLYHWVKNGGFLSSQGSEPPVEQNTAIGRLGELKMSRRIEWRLSVPKGKKPPERAMTLAYNHYQSGKWRSHDPNFQDYDRSFSDLLTIADKKDRGEFAFNTEGFQANEIEEPKSWPIYLRGAVNSNRKALPCPPAPTLIAKALEVDSIEQSQLGTLLVVNAANVVDLEIHTGDDPSLREAPPTQRIRNGQVLETTSLALPSNFRESRELVSLAAQLSLNELDDSQKIEALGTFFQENFRYSTHLKTTSQADKTALINFLTNTREGHCEYFATATTLLLRAAGVPSHYVVGFAVREQSNTPGEYLLRGSHAHAWCRAYLGGRKQIIEEEQIVTLSGGKEQTITVSREVWSGGQWTDVDLTPATWLTLDSPNPNLKERIADSFQRLREDFQLWRANERNRGWVNLALVIIAVALAAFVIWRLSGSRIRKEKSQLDEEKTWDQKTNLLTLSLPQLEESLGKKPAGQLLSTWLRTVLPEFPLPSLKRLFDLHDSERFSNHSLQSSETREFETLVESLQRTCAQRKDR
ncbi:MAG: transglutaminase-like domain-containing protein [Roseibacillus sp.]